MCSDRKTVINRDQFCDGVEDCPVTDNSFYLVAEDEGNMCPGEFLIFLQKLKFFGCFVNQKKLNTLLSKGRGQG